MSKHKKKELFSLILSFELFSVIWSHFSSTQQTELSVKIGPRRASHEKKFYVGLLYLMSIYIIIWLLQNKSKLIKKKKEALVIYWPEHRRRNVDTRKAAIVLDLNVCFMHKHRLDDSYIALKLRWNKMNNINQRAALCDLVASVENAFKFRYPQFPRQNFLKPMLACFY